MVNVVIGGCGRVGEETARIIRGTGYTVAGIDNREEQCRRMREGTLIDSVVEGDVTDETILQQVEINDDTVFVGMTNNQDTNIRACELVRQQNDAVQTVARRTDIDEDITSNAVDDVVYPERSGAYAVRNAITDSFDTIQTISGDVQIIQVRAAEGAPIANMKLQDVMFPSGARVISDDAYDTIVSGETTIEAGVDYLVAAEPQVVDDVRKLFQS